MKKATYLLLFFLFFLYFPGLLFAETEVINLLEERNKYQQEQQAEEPAEEADSYADLYKIELLVFAYVNTGEENSEKWRNPEKPDFSRFRHSKKPNPDTEETTADPAKNTTQNSRIFLDPESTDVSDMGSILKKMAINGHYRTLYHQVWEQKVLTKEEKDLFHLRGGNHYLTEADFQLSKNLLLSMENAEEKQVSDLGQGEYATAELEGTLHFYKSRYLHVLPNLWFTEFSINNAGTCSIEEEPQSSQAEIISPDTYTAVTNYTINQPRRLKSGELHYIDHPMFGLLLKFTKIQPPEILEPESDS